MAARPRKPSTDTVADLAAGMQRAVEASGFSLRRLEQEAGLKPDSIRNITRKLSHDPKGSVVEAVAAFMGIEAAALRGEAAWPEKVRSHGRGRLAGEDLRKLAAAARLAASKAHEAVTRAQDAAETADHVVRAIEALLEDEPVTPPPEMTAVSKRRRRG